MQEASICFRVASSSAVRSGGGERNIVRVNSSSRTMIDVNRTHWVVPCLSIRIFPLRARSRSEWNSFFGAPHFLGHPSGCPIEGATASLRRRALCLAMTATAGLRPAKRHADTNASTTDGSKVATTSRRQQRRFHRGAPRHRSAFLADGDTLPLATEAATELIARRRHRSAPTGVRRHAGLASRAHRMSLRALLLPVLLAAALTVPNRTTMPRRRRGPR